MKTKQVNKTHEKKHMGLLADWQIVEMVQRYGMIEPFTPAKVDGDLPSWGLEPQGYTMRAGASYKVPTGWDDENDKYIFTDGYIGKNKKGQDCIIVPPQSFILAFSMERWRFPAHISGKCWPKSTWCRYGTPAMITKIEGGWEGYLTIEIPNNGWHEVKIPIGGGLAQMEFNAGNTPATPYEGRYQNQKSAPQPAIVI